MLYIHLVLPSLFRAVHSYTAASVAVEDSDSEAEGEGGVDGV